MATVGINTYKIGTMQSELDEYMNKLKSRINISSISHKTERAMQGSSSGATLQAYARAIDNEINYFINQLSAYKTQLDEVKAAYIRDDQANTTFTSAQKNL